MLETVLGFIGVKGIILVLIAGWLIFALTKRLVKLAVLAAVVFALVYFVYPLVAPALSR